MAKFWPQLDLDMGLDLDTPESKLPAGALVRALNLSADFWGPRRGSTRIDNAVRDRDSMAFNGTSTAMTLGYNSAQFDLGRFFALDLFFEITSLPTVNPAWMWGNDHATDRSLDVYLNTDGTVDAYLEDEDGGTALLEGTIAYEAGDEFHIRVTRDKATSKLFCDGVLDASDATLGVNAAMAIVEEDRLVGVTPTYGTGEYFDAILGMVLLRSYADTDFQYAYAELPFPRTNEVLGLWSEALSSSVVRDHSASSNYGSVANGAISTRIVEIDNPVQGIMTTTLLNGKKYNIVAVGGHIYAEAV